MIRILQVITSMYIGGAEKLITDMTPLMQSEGLEVEVLLFDGTDTPFKQILEKNGIPIHCFQNGGSVYNPIHVYRLLSILPKYDIIHTHNTACQFYVALASCLINKKHRPKLVTTEHNTTNSRRNIPLFKYVDVWMYRQYNRIVAISDKAQVNLVDYLKIKKEQVKVIYNGINLDVFHLHDSSRVHIIQEHKQDNVNIVMVAGFREQKDQKTLIKAMALLPENYHLWLVGDGVCKQSCEDFVKEMRLTKRVEFLGQRNDIPALLQASDIVVMSSFYEGLSLSSIEGMASGRPFVASDVDGLHEITEGAGILFPRGDSQNLANQILKLMSDTDYYNNIVTRCKNKAKNYDIQTTVRKYIQIYKELLNV